MDQTITFVSDPPRPAGGTGDVEVAAGDIRVVLHWANNAITGLSRVNSGSGELHNLEENDGGFEDITMNNQTLGIVTCYKCARDSTTGQKVCWPVPC
jgi:hypothetical protein